MDNIKNLLKSFIAIFSESIWIYYIAVMFTSIEWTSPVYFDPKWWLVAGAAGYVLNIILSKINGSMPWFVGNILVLGFMIWKNWMDIVPKGYLYFGITASIGLSFVYIRSALIKDRQPTRQQMLRRFEGNVLYYIFFSVIFAVNGYDEQFLHVLFISAIIISLMGMLLTLQSYDEASPEDENTEIRKVGRSGWFTGVITALLGCIILITLAFLLPSVNKALYNVVTSIWRVLSWIYSKIGEFLYSLFSRMPDYDMKDIMPEDPLKQNKEVSERFKEVVFSIPYEVVIGGMAVIGVILAVWICSKLIRNKKVSKAIKIRYTVVKKESLWTNLRKMLKNCLKSLNLKLRMAFPYFYYQAIYWHYHKLQRWGKKKGLTRLKSETSREYVKRIIDIIPEGEKNFSCQGENYNLPELLWKLNRDYQTTYYGEKVQEFKEKEYECLINKLEDIRK